MHRRVWHQYVRGRVFQCPVCPHLVFLYLVVQSLIVQSLVPHPAGPKPILVSVLDRNLIAMGDADQSGPDGQELGFLHRARLRV
jgi:hypothetical protein